jgi:predicted membrane channel-forming protein YqfA (hemolysin III family)
MTYIKEKPVHYHVISEELGKTLTWVSLSFSFAGFLLYMFSKEKVEDEFIERLRYMSLAKSLLITWVITSALLIIHGELQLEGFYILQFQLFLYVVIYNYYKKWKFMVA